MGRLNLLLAGLLLVPLLSSVVGQEVPDEVGEALNPLLDPTVDTAGDTVYNGTGEDIKTEDIRIDAVLDITNVDYQLVGIIFGGGKVQADAVATIHLEFRAIGLDRLDDALRSATGDLNASAAKTLGLPANRTAVTAEELRLLGAGVVLQAFQDSMAGFVARFVQDTVPGMTVLDLALQWSDTLPLAEQRGLISTDTLDGFDPTDALAFLVDSVIPDLREPPIGLDAVARIQYLDRFQLVSLLDKALQDKSEKQLENKELKDRINDEFQPAFLDRNAFSLLGYGQLLNFQLPPGWRIQMVLMAPQGFTVEQATDAFTVAEEHDAAGYTLDGGARTLASDQAGIVTLSNRFVVTTTVLMVTLLVGVLIRVPTEIGLIAWLHRKRD